MNSPKFLFADVVVINQNVIGVILKTWQNNDGYNYDVYNRMNSTIKTYHEDEIERYKVRHKYLNEEEMDYQSMC